MTKMFQKFEFPAWSCQIFTKEIKIPENQIRHHFRIHLGNPLCSTTINNPWIYLRRKGTPGRKVSILGPLGPQGTLGPGRREIQISGNNPFGH